MIALFCDNTINFFLGPIPKKIPTNEKIQGVSDENLDIYWTARQNFKMTLSRFFLLKNISTKWTLKVKEDGRIYNEEDFCGQQYSFGPRSTQVKNVFYTNGLRPDPTQNNLSTFKDNILNTLSRDLKLQAKCTSNYRALNSSIEPPFSPDITNVSATDIICPDTAYAVPYYSYDYSFERTFTVEFGTSAYLDPETLTVWPDLKFGGNYNYATWQGLGNTVSRNGSGVDFESTAQLSFDGIGILADPYISNTYNQKIGSLDIKVIWNPISKKPLV